MMRTLFVALCLCAFASAKAEPILKSDDKVMDGIAESYVKLVLAMGEQDADYVDAYYGPPEWKSKAVE